MDKLVDTARSAITDAMNALNDLAHALAQMESADMPNVAGFLDEAEGLLKQTEAYCAKFDKMTDPDPRQKGDDDGVEYGHPGDALRDRY